MTKCSIVAVVGAPNAGKSTLVNRLTGAKVSIVTHKAQTTRQRILGIYVEDNAQIILADTPGIFMAPKNKRLEQTMVKTALHQAEDADAILFVVDASHKSIGAAKQTLERLPQGKPRFLALNKIDKTSREKLLPLAGSLQEAGNFEAVYMISALEGHGCDKLRSDLAKAAPEGPFLYDEDALTNLPQRLWAAEITREQALLLLHDEIPYGLHVETKTYKEDDNQTAIEQIIWVANDRHKGMAIGKNAAKIKEIGTRARAALAAELETRVQLHIEVRTGDGASRAVKQIEESI